MKRNLWIGACAAVAALGVILLRVPKPAAGRFTPQEAAHASRQAPATERVRSASESRASGRAAWQAAGARLLTPVLGEPSEGPKATANASLERALEEEDEDPAWTRDVHGAVTAALAEDPQIRVEAVRCTSTFCRLRLTKPIASRLDWPEIDQKLAPIARGETIFSALPTGTVTTAHVYFSALDTSLPLDHPSDPADEG
jgi:hypothetical protein